MNRFIVPQFIEEESRILGKITVRQFIILVVAGIITVFIIRLADFNIMAVILTIIFWTGPAIVVALVKINGMNFHIFALNVLNTFKKPRLRVWNKNISLEDLRIELERNEQLDKKKKKFIHKKHIPSSSKLAELALIVDTGGVYKGE